jgi:hypothetical protein
VPVNFPADLNDLVDAAIHGGFDRRHKIDFLSIIHHKTVFHWAPGY